MTCVTYTVTVSDDKAGVRLDRLLADAITTESRTRLRRIIDEGGVCLDDGGAIREPDRRVHAGERFHVRLPPAAPERPVAQAMALTVVFEDEHLIVIDKPAGLVVHPGAGNADGTLVNGLLAHGDGRLSSIGAPLRPGIVHRLDKDTSGVMVVAKTDAAHADLARQFAEHSVERAYHALVWGRPLPADGRVVGAIGRSSANRLRMAMVKSGGKAALTLYRTVAGYGTAASRIECRPRTGRTHQIRVHMAAIGHPLLGDGLYGGGRTAAKGVAPEVARVLGGFARHALHAYVIGFRHPSTGVRLHFESDLPNDMSALIDVLEHL
jgi:23S rRNA pseudouridine1911/1915/1917 synthase